MTPTTTHDPALPASVLQLLAAAPHRLLFLVGAANVLLAMAWWTAWLLSARWQIFDLPALPVPAGWMHSIVMQYHVLPSFIFGFLLTVFPRWINQPALKHRHYVPVGLGLLAGQALTLLALFSGWPLLKAGALSTIAGWSIGIAILGNLLRSGPGRTWHAVSCLSALTVGLIGLVLYALFLFGYDARLIHSAIKLGGISLLLPVFFSVCHRMIPFFTSSVLKEYRPQRPMWALIVFWAAVITHTAFELLDSYAWTWLADLPMTMLTSWLLWRWWPRTTNQTPSPPQSIPPLLWVLFGGFAWLPLAFFLYTLQSMWFAATGTLILGRGPAHALFIGFFGSLLVAMVTRVTQGHSGRVLVLGRVASFAFVIVQIVAMVRVLSEISADPLGWQTAAAIGWLLAFAPWVIRSIWIYLSPRIDGKPG